MMAQFQVILQLFLALVLGGLIGLEREYKKREAGLRTHSLVALGSCLFTQIGILGFAPFLGKPGMTLDLSRIIQAVAVGIGFIGAGLIVFRQKRIEGLTTAAGLWVAAAIGIAVGIELYFLAIFTTFLAIVVLAGLRLIEEKIFRTKSKEDE